MGSGTWTFTSPSTTNILDITTVTNLTLSSSSANLVFTANAVSRQAHFGTSNTFASLTISANSTKGSFVISANTAVAFNSVTVGSGNTIAFPQGVTTTVSGAFSMTGTSSAPVGAISSIPNLNVATISVGSAVTIDWGAILRITKAGAGSITATNSLDLGGNTNISITAPSAGGGGGGRIIGG